MTGSEIPSLRRRPIPGMTATNHTAQPDRPVQPPDPPTVREPTPASPRTERAQSSIRAASRHRRPDGPDDQPRAVPSSGSGPERRPAADYSATRLVNFRLPADLHDRYKQLVRDAAERHPRLRHPSLTEVVIALLEEGPSHSDEVAGLIWRKRAGEYGAQA